MAAPIKSEIAREQIPISYSSLGAEDYGARLTDDYDVVDVHFMPNVINDAEDQKRFKGTPFGITRFPGGNVPVFAGQQLTIDPQKYDLATFSRAWDSACRWHYAAVSWDCYKRYNGDSLRIVASMDFKGSSLYNYAEPIFSLWQDADWQWAANSYFLAATAREGWIATQLIANQPPLKI
jgi:hypothetical protein